MEIVKDDKDSPARLVINGHNDENEETLLMTIEEAHNYVLSKIEEYIRDSNTNPLIVMKNQIAVLHEKISQKNEELGKLNKMFDALYRDQVKFLRHIGVMPKLETKTVGVGVDLPWLPDSMPGSLREDLLKNSSDRVFLTTNATQKNQKKEANGPIECIDLTDDEPPTTPSANKNQTSGSSNSTSAPVQNTPSVSAAAQNTLSHPAPLPDAPHVEGSKNETPPKPRLKIFVDKNGIVLQWDLPPEGKNIKLMSYEIVGYQEKNNVPISSALWKKIGCVNPMPLPMSCTLTQFVSGFRYHFSIRAIAKDRKYGLFSEPASIMFEGERKKS